MKTNVFNKLTGLKEHDLIANTQGYLADSITLQALAANSSLQEKASLSGQNISHTTLQRTDYKLISRNVLNTSFAGYTGQVDFNQECNRVANTFTILNVVPSNEDTSTPYTVERRGHIYTGPDDIKIIFCQSNGTISGDSTLVFRDGTTNIPLDHIKRLYIRCKDNIVDIAIHFFYLIFYFNSYSSGDSLHDYLCSCLHSHCITLFVVHLLSRQPSYHIQ